MSYSKTLSQKIKKKIIHDYLTHYRRNLWQAQDPASPPCEWLEGDPPGTYISISVAEPGLEPKCPRMRPEGRSEGPIAPSGHVKMSIPSLLDLKKEQEVWEREKKGKTAGAIITAGSC